MTTGSNDKAGKAYWDQVWSETELPPLIDLTSDAPESRVNSEFHRLFAELFAKENDLPAKTYLEIGCALSPWLPYFATKHGFKVSGLDYSEHGCVQARQLLTTANVPGEVYCADAFRPPEELRQRFGVVASFGVAEHFEDTVGCIRAFAEFAAPGGLLITSVPNMSGAVGWLQRILDRAVYDIHVPLSAKRLAEANSAAGLEIVQCDYVMSTNFWVANIGTSARFRFPKRVLHKLFTIFTSVVWKLERVFGPMPKSRLLSPYVVCVARKPR